VQVLEPSAPLASTYDVIVVGSGVGGLSTALFAALRGAQVLIVESTEFVGGTSATSAGTVWIPCTQYSAQVNDSDTLAQAALYLDHAVGARAPSALRQAFLSNGVSAVALLAQKTQVLFRPYAKHPDYISELPGSTLNGRAIEPVPFDGRLLGKHFRLLRAPIPEFMVLGRMMVDRTDINHLLGLTKSFTSFAYSAKIIVHHALDRLFHPRGTRLVMGNALVARLIASLQAQAWVTLATNTTLISLESGVAVFSRQGIELRVGANQGIVLASGGFNRHKTGRAQRLPSIPSEWCPAAPGHTGVAQDAALALGAKFQAQGSTQAFWAPVSLRVRADGSTAAFPHFVMDRAKPGTLVVNAKGQRFENESTSYHLFALAMQHTQSIPAFLVCDAPALKKYGLGMVRPGTSDVAPFLKDQYLTQAASLEALAQALGIDAQGLQTTVAAMNGYAASGKDLQFGRGETAYAHNIGDASAGTKNPNLGEIRTAPFYAVKLVPGDIGACAGLAINAQAQVLDGNGEPIAGLYAVGNDAQSVMGDVYPAPGITLGPAIVFGYIAVSHMCAQGAKGQRQAPVNVLS
jgi:FAD binding domain